MPTQIVLKKKREIITRKQVDELIAKHHAVHIYCRKRVVCVDGSKYYKLVE